MQVGPVSSGRSAVIVATDIDLLESLVLAAGYEIVGTAETGVNGEHLVAHLRPDVVVVENDLVGEPGWFAIPRLRAASPSTQVLLVVTEDWTPRDLGSTGAFAVVTRARLGELVEELDDLAGWITKAEATAGAADERRTGRDRRHRQDWTKVGWERRHATRRTADAA